MSFEEGYRHYNVQEYETHALLGCSLCQLFIKHMSRKPPRATRWKADLLDHRFKQLYDSENYLLDWDFGTPGS